MLVFSFYKELGKLGQAITVNKILRRKYKKNLPLNW
jgi:hypothetical protein